MNLLKSLLDWLNPKDKNIIPIEKFSDRIETKPVFTELPKDIDGIYKVFKEFKLEKYWETIRPHIKNRINVVTEPANEDVIPTGKSKIGGQPDLSSLTDWPITEAGKSLSFIAQLNMAEVSPYDNSGLLPDHGLISFFYCADQGAWGFDPKDKQRFKILFTENLNDLQKTTFPIDLEEHSIYNSNILKMESTLSLPNTEIDLLTDLFDNDTDWDNYYEISSGWGNQILGYPQCIQNAMELECQLVTNGLYCGDASGYDDPKGKLLEEGTKDWILLLQVDSEEDKTGMMWGDVGILYYWIKKKDLINKDFDKAWFILQCH